METGIGPGMRSPGGRSGQGDTAQAPPPRGAARRGRGAEVRDAAGGRPRSCRGVGRGFRGSRGDPCDRRLCKPDPGIWGPRCTPTAKAPSGTAAPGRAGPSPAAPWDAPLLPCGFPSSRPGAGGMPGWGGEGSAGHPPPTPTPPSPFLLLPKVSAEFEAERGAVARPPSRLPLGCWAPRDGESPRRRAQARSTRTFGTQRLSDASPARRERL